MDDFNFKQALQRERERRAAEKWRMNNPQYFKN